MLGDRDAAQSAGIDIGGLARDQSRNQVAAIGKSSSVIVVKLLAPLRTGASFTLVTVMLLVAVAVLNAVVPPPVEASAV